ncbi:MAG: oligosaccharide flippase family protein, partial [Acidilobaceae archaeon]
MSRYSEKLLKGTVLLSAGSIISLVIAAAGSIIIARLLGPENYGLIGISMILPNLMLALTDLGINTALTRYSSIRDSSMKTIVVSGLTLKIILSLLSALIVYITAPYVAKALGRPYIEPYIKLLSIFTLASLLYGALNSILIGYGLYALSSISQVILTIIRVSSAVLLVILGYGVTGAILGHVIAWLLTTIPLLVYTLKLIGLPLTISLKSIRELLHYGIPLHLPVVISIPLGQLYYSIMVRVSSDWEIGN